MSDVLSKPNITKTDEYVKIEDRFYRKDIIELDVTTEQGMKEIFDLIRLGIGVKYKYDKTGQINYKTVRLPLTARESLLNLKIECLKEDKNE